MTSLGLILAAFTAAKASSSRSKTRAGPRCTSFFWPETLATQPSGARLPRRMARPPSGLIGSSSACTTFWPGVSRAARASSPIVRPVTVISFSKSRPASSSRRATTPMPPASCISGAV